MNDPVRTSDHADAVEAVLVRDWHEDQCHCDDFDGVDMDTCYTRKFDNPFFYPPMTWTVDAVLVAYESARGDVSVAPEHWSPSERAAYDCGFMDGRGHEPRAITCLTCGGLNGNHGFVHLRHGNGGGHNEPCPNATALEQGAGE